MKKRLFLITILALLLILAASATLAFAGRPAGQTSPTLEGVRWVLVSYKDSQGKEAAVLPDAPATAEFASAKVSGSTGCNTYTAGYVAKDNSLKIGQTATTMKACADPIMAQEQAFLADIQAAATYKIDGEQLTIADASAAVVLTFKAEKAGTLVGPTWLMTAYNNGTGGFQSAMAGVEVTAVFGQDGQLTGNSGCNSYSATYSVDGDKIKIGPTMSTKMACDQPVMNQEMAYLTALMNASTYKIEGAKLTLRDASGAAMAGYTRAPAAVQAPAAAATSTGTAKPAAAPATGIFLTLRPAADGSVQTVVLSLNQDGKAAFNSDFSNDKSIAETGTWAESNGLVTVTLTDKDGAKLAAPEVLKFQRDGTYLILTDFDKAVWGEKGLKLNLAADIARKVRSGMVTLDLAAGAPLDPTFFSANGGGEVDSRLLSSACSGFINRQPTATVKWSGEADQVRAFFYSDGDPTLMVLTPKGELLCNDNAGPQLLDPFVEIKNPAAGDYRIWVGSAVKNQLVPGVLVLTTKPGVDLGTFKLGSLIKRPSIPQAPVTATAEMTTTATASTKLAPQVQALADKLLKGAPELKPGAKVTVDVTADGIIPLFRIPAAADKGCAGLVTGAPSYAFKWTGKADNLHFAVDASADTTLMVVTTGGRQVWCNDDAKQGTVNPAIDIANPADDTYLVYVGRVSPKAPVNAKLTVAEAAKEQ